MLRRCRNLALGWIQMPRVRETEASCDWDVELEATVVIGSRAHIVTIVLGGGPRCMCCLVVVNECVGSEWGKWSLVDIETAINFLVG